MSKTVSKKSNTVKVLTREEKRLAKLERELAQVRKLVPEATPPPHTREPPMAIKAAKRKQAEFRRLLKHMSPERVLDPCLHSWTKLSEDPAKGPLVPIPMSDELVPCPVNIVRNYGSVNHTIVAGAENLKLSLFPDGTLTSAGEPTVVEQGLYVGGLFGHIVGPNLNGSTPGILGWVRTHPTSWDSEFAWSSTVATNVVGYAISDLLQFDAKTTPFTLPLDKDWTFRNSAVEVRISYVGEARLTKGYVNFFQSFDPPADSTALSNIRATGQYDRFFLRKGTFRKVIKPNCDNFKWKSFVHAQASSTVETPCRTFITIEGLEAGDEILIEFYAVDEYHTSLGIGGQVSGYETPDKAALGNGVLASFRSDSSLRHAVAASKVSSHPVMSTVAKVAEAGFAGTGIAGLASKIASSAEAIGPFVEASAPLLL